MITGIILLLVGYLLIFFEFYLPGGIMGGAGCIIVIISIIVFATQSDSAIATFVFGVSAFVGLSFLFKYALWRIKQAKPEYSVYSDDAQEGFIASIYDKDTMGKNGHVSTDLRPGGHVLIEGKKHSAISQSGYIPRGEEITVIGGQGESLIVKRRKKEQKS